MYITESSVPSLIWVLITSYSWNGCSGLGEATRDEAYDGSYEEEIKEEFVPPYINADAAKFEYDRVVTYASIPQYGQCWTDALEGLRISCKQLTEIAHMRLAFDFANCFLQKSEISVAECPEDGDIKRCVKESQNASSHFFHSYLEFYTHTQSICFYLASELWHRRANQQVASLYAASTAAVASLKEIRSTQSLLHQSQKDSLVNAEEIRSWFGAMTDHISQLQSYFIDEFMGFHSVAFYFAAAAVAFGLTATNRTAGARIWVVPLLFCTFLVERYLRGHKLGEFARMTGGLPSAQVVTENLNEDAWLIRKTYCAISLGIIAYYLYSYVDVNALNYRLIQDVHDRLFLHSTSAGANHGVDQNDARNRRQLSVENGGNRAGLDGRSLSLVRRPLPDSGSSYQSSPGSQDYRLSWESRMRRSVTPLRTFMATPIKNGNLAPVAENDQDDSANRGGSQIRPDVSPRNLGGRDRTPFAVNSPKRPYQHNRPPSVSGESPANFGARLLRAISREPEREPTPERLNQHVVILQQVINAVDLSMENGKGVGDLVHAEPENGMAAGDKENDAEGNQSD